VRRHRWFDVLAALSLALYLATSGVMHVAYLNDPVGASHVGVVQGYAG
jgi:hypothetical protein